MQRSIFLFAAFVLALSGCSVGPDYRHPELPTPAAWKQPGAGNDWPQRDWWQRFALPELNALMEQAAWANPDFGAAVARLREAEAQVKISGAALLPSVQATAGAARSRSLSTVPKNASKPVGQDSFGASLSAGYELDFWGRLADAQDMARAAAEASRFDQQTIALTVQAQLADSYFLALALDERLKVAARNLANAQATLDAVRARASHGLAAGLDIAQQESVVAELRAAMPPLRQQLRQTVNSMAILTGQLPDAVAPPSRTLAEVTIPEVGAGLPSGLLARRPDVQSAEAQLKAANADIKAAEAAIFPDVALTAQGGAQSHQLSTLLDPASVLYSLAASLTQQIFRGGALEGGIELKQARYDELLEGYRKAVLTAFVDVENALVAVEQGKEQEAAQARAAATAREALTIAQGQLRAGTADILSVLTAQRTLYQAEDLLVQVRLARAQAAVALFRALGGGWQG
ncbi:MAG TPA: efflux transporter outer membrane subunit [Rhodospirillaceae bacterium]|nr:efflux transporter outer membrane subunit [Rhodospirillaceae bacterium]